MWPYTRRVSDPDGLLRPGQWHVLTTLCCAALCCAVQGTVVYLCGSTGLAGDSLRYVRMLAGLGYLVIAPDALAGTSPLRHRRPRLILRPDQATDYWERNLLYEDDGAEVRGASRRLTLSSP